MLLAAGYSVEGLIVAGCSARELLAAGCSVRRLRGASVTALQLRDAGCDVRALEAGGFPLEQLRGCGFSAAQLLQECGSSIVDVRTAGYTAAECIACGIPASKMSSVTTLAGRVFRTGCYTLQQLHQAHVGAEQAMGAGFSVTEMQAAR
jgi:intracellular multiplication protein IcmE